MPLTVSLTTACWMEAGDGKPAAWCALVMDVSFRWRLAGLWSAARAVIYKVTVSGVAGRATSPLALAPGGEQAPIRAVGAAAVLGLGGLDIDAGLVG